MMSLSKGFDSAVYDIFSPESGADMRDGASMDPSAFPDSAMDVFAGRSNSMNQPPLQSGSEPEQVVNPSDPIQNAIHAMQEARDMARHTTKLEAGKMTTADGPKATTIGDFAKAKGAAVEGAQTALAAVQKEIRGAAGNAQAPAPSGSGIGGAARSAAATSVAAAAANVVWPSAGTAINVAGLGSMATANAPLRSFRSAADSKGYGSGEGHHTVDVMTGKTYAGSVSVDINKSMAQGPGFGPLNMAEIRHSTEASLECMKPGAFSEEGIQAMQAQLAEMGADAKLGSSMYHRWCETGISVAEAAEEMPLADLNLNESQKAALVSDNPADKLKTVSPLNFA